MLSKDWEIVIGLELHAQIISESKAFSSSSTKYGSEPNTQVSYVDVAMPGMLPVLNSECVRQIIKTGLGLGAEINLYSVFDRKNYFYQDLPQGYQITQYTHPIVGQGVVHLEMPNDVQKVVRITRIHLEHDAAKSLYDQHPSEILVDFNRTNVGLMEIVSEPDMRSAEEAAEFVKKMRAILRYLGTCDGNMENGSLRCDANISLRKFGAEKFGTRVELKNINSIKNIAKAINIEAGRQAEILESGGTLTQETRLFDPDTNSTKSARDKESALDYRYFPDPDLLPLVITEEYVEEIRKSLPMLPDEKKKSYVEQMNLTPYDASAIVADKDSSVYFDELAKVAEPKLAANWMLSELFGRLNKADLDINESPVTADNFGALLALITQGVISGKIAKQIFDIMFVTKESPEVIMARENLRQIGGVEEITGVVKEVLDAHPEKVQEYRSGKDKLFGFFVGQIMQKTRGQADPVAVNKVLHELLPVSPPS